MIRPTDAPHMKCAASDSILTLGIINLYVCMGGCRVRFDAAVFLNLLFLVLRATFFKDQFYKVIFLSGRVFLIYNSKLKPFLMFIEMYFSDEVEISKQDGSISLVQSEEVT